MSKFKKYQRKGLSEMRPYIPGEDLTKVSVNPVDRPEEGGMIARNPMNHEDQWYVSKKYFEENLEEVSSDNVCERKCDKDFNGLLEVGKGTFGMAIEAAKHGKKVARVGWNGSGMFAYIVPANSYPALTGVAKSYFGENVMVPYRAYWALKTAQEDIATWAPSGSDALAEDWTIVE